LIQLDADAASIISKQLNSNSKISFILDLLHDCSLVGCAGRISDRLDVLRPVRSTVPSMLTALNFNNGLGECSMCEKWGGVTCMHCEKLVCGDCVGSCDLCDAISCDD